MRRLPVYLVVDSSESMIGPPIEAINRGIESMVAGLKKNPYALETVWLSVITFDSIARVLVPMTDIVYFRFPEIQVKPGTSIGLAIQLLMQQIRKDSVKTTANEKGDFRPLVFFLTDGQPTDSYEVPLKALREMRPKPANIYGIGCGNEVDFEVLREMADVAFHLDEMTPEKFAKFFIWMSASVQSVSQGFDERVSLDKNPLPDGFTVVDNSNMPPHSDIPLQVFLHAICSTVGKKYLMRFVYLEQNEVYAPVASYPLPESFFANGDYLPPPISSERLIGIPECPYCHNAGWGQCGNCQTGFCVPAPAPRTIICPHCKANLTMGDSSSFDIKRSSG